METVIVGANVIERMVNDGQLTQIDEIGHVHALFGSRPDDGARAVVCQVTREGHRIIEVILRCPSCGRDIAAEPGGLRGA